MILLPFNMFVNMPVNHFLLVTFYCLHKAVVVLGRKINIIRGDRGRLIHGAG